MNLNFRRRDRRHQEMDFSLPASLFLLSVVFWQFVSAADQNHSPIKSEHGQNAFLPCKDSDEGGIQVVEWSRTDLESGFVLLYRDGKIDLRNQHPSYRDRMDLLVGQIQKRDASVVLKNTTIADSGTYECRVKQTNRETKLISTVSLVVAPPPPPPPVPFWAAVLLVLLSLALVAAAVVLYFWLRWKPDSQVVEVESGEKFVKLPFKVPRCLWFIKYRTFLHVDKVKWKNRNDDVVHVYQNGSDQPGEQNLIYRTRTKMDKNLLKNGDLSLTLRWPIDGDNNIYTCRVYNKNGEKLMEKNVWLKVKVPKVVVESGVESVLLPWTITENLDGDVKVEWKDEYNRKVYVYQNGSDQFGEQNWSYQTRTKMEEDPLRTGDLSLTLTWPTERDRGIYTCRVYNRVGDKLMKKQIDLQVKVLEQVEMEPGVESVLLPWRTTKDLDEDVKVEWKDVDNRTVHVYQNGSDQPGEQSLIYRTRTKMDENLLKNKNLSLTLMRPTERDYGIYTCRVYNKDEVILMMKHVQLKGEGTVQVQNQPEDTRTRSNPTDPLMDHQSV